MGNPLKKTMVFLGLAEEDLELAESREPHAAETPATALRPTPQKATVTPLRKATPARQPAAGTMNEILTVHPTEYREAATVAESFREGIPVIMNLSRMNDADAKRLIDFASGLSMGLNGRIERVTTKVFLLSPEHIVVNGDAPAQQGDSGSFFVSPA